MSSILKKISKKHSSKRKSSTIFYSSEDDGDPKVEWKKRSKKSLASGSKT
jgi:hypothetical protein